MPEQFCVRPFTFTDAEILIAEGDLNAHTFCAERPRTDADPHLVPITLRRLKTRDIRAVHDPSSPPLARPRGTAVGQMVPVEGQTIFGSVREQYVFDSPEAARAFAPREEPRTWLLMVETDPDDPQAVTLPTAPIFGAEANVKIIVADMDPQALTERIELALRAEFTDAEIRTLIPKARPVQDARVDVFDSDGNLLAANILQSEVGVVMAANGPVTTRPSNPNLVVGS